MFDLFKKAVLVGLGLQARANAMIETLMEEGASNQRKEAKWARDLLARLEKDTESLDRRLGDLYKKAVSIVDLPSREEFNTLSKKVEDLISRLGQAQRAR